MYYAKKYWVGGGVVYNFVPFVAPEAFNDPSKYADFGCTVNLHEKFRIYKMTYPEADVAVEFSDVIENVSLSAFQIPPAGATIEVFETVLGEETSVLYTTTGTHSFTSGSTKRYMIRRVASDHLFNLPVGSVWAYCFGISYLNSPITTHLKYVFFYENTLIKLASFRLTSITGVLTINGGVTNIPMNTFKQCSNLTKVIIGDSVSIIAGGNQSGAFYQCTGLLEADLGTGITSIGVDTFNGCTSLASIICRAYKPPIVAGAFRYMPTTTKFYVPHERVNVYKAANGWREFASRIYSINDL